MSAPQAGMTGHDRGLQAVRRVRAARERDSRLGLARAIEEHRSLAARVESLTAGLAEASAADPGVGSGAAYAVTRARLVALGERLASAKAAAESARRVVGTSRDHWLADHRGLESVDGLLARRREARALEATRREARAEDETAARMWARDADARDDRGRTTAGVQA